MKGFAMKYIFSFFTCLVLFFCQFAHADLYDLTPIAGGNYVDSNRDGIFDFSYANYGVYYIRDSVSDSPTNIARNAKEYVLPPSVKVSSTINSASLRIGFSSKKLLTGALNPQLKIYSYVANGSFEPNGDLTPSGDPLFSIDLASLMTGQTILDVTMLVRQAQIKNQNIGLLYLVDTGAELLQYTDPYWNTISIDYLASNTPTNYPPSVKISSPAPMSTPRLGTPLNFIGTASDVEDGDLSGSIKWEDSVYGVLGIGASVNNVSLSIGLHTITASVTDANGNKGLSTVQVTVLEPENKAPVISIINPTVGASYVQGQVVAFSGSAIDNEDGDIGNKIQWTSSISGALGQGTAFSTTLVAGNHLISASVTDSGGKTSTFTRSLNIQTQTPSQYCSAKGASTSYEFINQVKLNNYTVTSGNNSGYYTNTTPLNANRGTNTIDVIAGYARSQYTEYFSVYVDLDNNNAFTGAELLTSGSGQFIRNSLVIPASTTLGLHKMRVLMKYGSLPTPCESFSFGEVEDYMLNVIF